MKGPGVGRFVSGVLNIDKPQGWTSHDVVAKVRWLAKQRRVGHAGTLDPMATGVLLVCLGKATRVAEYLAARPKTYRATIRFGLVTDTWDAEGQPVSEHSTSDLTRGAIEAVLPRFRGPISQIPPMYSAVKRDGQPLYKLARLGQVVDREARPVEIYRLDVLAWRPAELDVEIVCSKGTYIRSLAHDLGQAVGTGAHLSALVRNAIGSAEVAQAVTLGTLEAAFESGLWSEHLVPMHRALDFLPHVVVDDAASHATTNTPPVGPFESFLKGHLLDSSFSVHPIIELARSALPKRACA